MFEKYRNFYTDKEKRWVGRSWKEGSNVYAKTEEVFPSMSEIRSLAKVRYAEYLNIIDRTM